MSGLRVPMGIDPAVRHAKVAAALDAEERDLAVFFGRNAHKYLRYWRYAMVPKDHRPAGKLFFGTLHWPAFFAFFPWAFYRRLYWQAFAFFAIVGGIILMLPDDAPIRLPIAVAGSALAYPIAIWTARRKIRKIRESGAPAEEIDARIKRAGGVSVTGAILGSLLMLLLFAGGVFAVVAERRQANGGRAQSAPGIHATNAAVTGTPHFLRLDPPPRA